MDGEVLGREESDQEGVGVEREDTISDSLLKPPWFDGTIYNSHVKLVLVPPSEVGSSGTNHDHISLCMLMKLRHQIDFQALG